MKFCIKCDNMYYIGINSNDANKLTYYCRTCGHVDESIADEGVCVIDSQLKKGEQKFNHIINPYTKFDPTLPRIYNIRCPNEMCKTNHADATKPAEIIFMRYDDANLKYIYICVECDTAWNTGA